MNFVKVLSPVIGVRKNPAYYAMFLGNCKGCLSRYGKNVGNELYY